MTLLLVTLVLLASELPDPGQPTFPNICGTFGGFIGMAIGIGRRVAWEQTMKLAAQVGAVGYGIGFGIWLVLVAIDLL
jgi:hypothetical protein